MRAPGRNRGFTLLEVMIALVVIAVGMLGTALMLSLSVRMTHSASVRGQVVLTAQSIIDRTSANVVGVWSGNYDDVDLYPRAAESPSACSTRQPCDAPTLAAHDVAQDNAELADEIPGLQAASLRCRRAGAVPPGDLRLGPPYDGVCNLQISWAETSDKSDVVEVQVMNWRFVP